MPFPTTRWSLIAEATLHGGEPQRSAWAEFYRRYRGPVVDHIRRRWPVPAAAEDLAQEFFVHLLEHATIQRAERARGRFRTFLLGALVRFLGHRRAHAQAAKRGGGQADVPWDALAAADAEPGVPAAVELHFDRQWARELMALARAGVEATLAARLTPAEGAVLLRFLPGAAATPDYESAAAGLGWALPRLKTEVHRLRRQFRDAVRREIALTVGEPHEVDAELAHLHRVLATPGD